jgi:hypothetical protein
LRACWTTQAPFGLLVELERLLDRAGESRHVEGVARQRVAQLDRSAGELVRTSAPSLPPSTRCSP